jgi:O-antigen ligase
MSSSGNTSRSQTSSQRSPSKRSKSGKHQSEYSYPKSSRSYEKAEKKRVVSLVDGSSIFLRILTLLFLFGLPWYYGCATWFGQRFVYLAATGLAIAAGLHCVVCMLGRSGDTRIPWPSYLFFGLAAYAFLQTWSVFQWDDNQLAPPSISIQKWALGLALPPKSVEVELLTQAKDASTTTPLDLSVVPTEMRRLAWSIEPLHTRASFPALILCGLLVWIGSMVFGNTKTQLWLLVGLTAIGTAIALVGIQGALSYKPENFLGLKSGSSFATFVSKNSAGAFLNIGVAGSLGLLGWTLLNTVRKTNDVRYRFPESNPLQKMRGAAEDLLADLNTPQIASMMCLVIIIAAVVISLCRGAAMSALAAIIIATIVANAKGSSRNTWISTMVLGVAAISVMVGFQIDDEAYQRIKSLTELDLEGESTQGRVYIWTIALKAMVAFGWLGSGLGTFHYAYLPFQQPSSMSWFYHAESLYLQCGVDLGWIGLIVLVCGLSFAMVRVQRSVPDSNWRMALPAKLAGAYLLVSQSLHSFVDFALILPANFVPASLLLGSVLGLLRMTQVEVLKRSSKNSINPSATITVSPLHRLHGAFGLIVCGFIAFAFMDAQRALSSMAASESMQTYMKLEDEKPLSAQLSEQTTDRVETLAKIWSLAGSLNENPIAMRLFADGILFDYRKKQVNARSYEMSLDQAWATSSTIPLQMALQQEKNELNRKRIIESVGGESALKQLELASNWYAKASAKSPLDWRLLWGRANTNLICPKSEMAKLLPALNQLSKHLAQPLLAATLIFPESFSSKELEDIRIQAIKSSPAAATNVANFIAAEQSDEDISIELFPQRSEILQSLATQVFTRERFPKTHFALWERAKKLIDASPMSEVRRQLWLADASRATDNPTSEIAHLKNALKYEPSSIPLICRIANRLVEINDMNQAKELCELGRRLDPLNPEVKALSTRLLAL